MLLGFWKYEENNRGVGFTIDESLVFIEKMENFLNLHCEQINIKGKRNMIICSYLPTLSCM